MAILVNPLALPRTVVRRFVPLAAYALAATFLAQPAVADQDDVLNVSAGSSLQYNSNLFSTPETAGPPPGFSQKSDYINTNYVGLRIDQPYALQRFQFDATYTIRRYQTFSYLDSDTLNYRGAWLWALTPRVTGTLTADRNQAQIPFTDITGSTQRNVRTTNNYNFTVDGWLTGGWHLLGGVGQTEVKTEQAVLSTPSYRNQRFEGGLRYVATSGNSITFMQRLLPTELVNSPLDPVNLIDTQYRDTESELKVNWKLNGNSSLDGRLTQKARRNEHFTQRDFSGTAGELRYVWTVAGKLQFNFAASRDILPSVAFGNIVQNSSYKVDQVLSINSVWQASAKTAVNVSLARTISDYRGPVFAITGPARNDELLSAQLGVNWALARYLSLNTSLGRDRRSSNIPGFEFTNTMVTVGAVLTF